MKDVVLLSEIHPLALQCARQYGNTFSPLHQACNWFDLFTRPEVKDIEAANLGYIDIIEMIHDRVTGAGKYMVIRDWSHLDFTGTPFIDEPSYSLTQADVLQDRFELLQIATVRHPVDQWSSLSRLEIMRGRLDLDSFLRGYLEFARQAKRIGFVRYEDFSRNPAESMSSICGHLDIPFDPGFEDKWIDYHKITGDKTSESRKEIRSTKTRSTQGHLLDSFRDNEHYHESCRILGYAPDLEGEDATRHGIHTEMQAEISGDIDTAAHFRSTSGTRPSISILVITYNHEKYISQCLKSLVEQTLQPTVIMVSDDCSTDGNWEIIQSFKNEFPNLFWINRNEQNLGPRRNMELLLSRIEGDYCSFIEGDDFWASGKLESEYLALESHPEAGAAYSNVAMTNEDGEMIHCFHDPMTDDLPHGDIFYRVATRSIYNRSHNCFRNYLFRTNCYRALNHQIDKNLPSMGDYDLHLTCAAHFPFAASRRSTPYVYYRNHQHGISKHRREVQLSQMLIYEKHDDEFSRLLDKEHEFMARLFQETNLSAMTDSFPEEKKAYYRPGNVLDRMIARLNSFSETSKNELWAQNISIFRQLIAKHIADLVSSSEIRKAHLVLTEYKEKDPGLLQSEFIPSGMFEYLEAKAGCEFDERLGKLRRLLS